MRGKGMVMNKIDGSKRITPAYAGKSSTRTSLTLARRDHPRLCGEKEFAYNMNK